MNDLLRLNKLKIFLWLSCCIPRPRGNEGGRGNEGEGSRENPEMFFCSVPELRAPQQPCEVKIIVLILILRI